MEGPAEAEIHLMINSQIAQQQPGKECCSETLYLSAIACKRKRTHCCKSYFLINAI